MPAEKVRTFIPTAPVASGFGIDIALECRVGESQPCTSNVQIPDLGAVGKITNLPAPPATATLECRDGQFLVIGSGTVTVQRELS